MKELMKKSMYLRSYGPMRVSTWPIPHHATASYAGRLPLYFLSRLLHSRYKTPLSAFLCKNYRERLDIIVVTARRKSMVDDGFQSKVCRAITLSISVQSCWLLCRNVTHDIIYARSRGDIGRRSCYPNFPCRVVLAASNIKTSLIHFFINIELLVSFFEYKCS